MVPSGLIDTTPPVNHFHLPTRASQGADALTGAGAPASTSATSTNAGTTPSTRRLVARVGIAQPPR